MEILTSDQIKARLRYQGKQYAAGQHSRGGAASGPHILEQAADRIGELEQALWSLREGLKGAVNTNIVDYIDAFLAGECDMTGGYADDIHEERMK